MCQDLINHRLDLTASKNILDVILKKVRQTDCFYFACLISVLQCFPCYFVFLEVTVVLTELLPRLRAVNDQKVDVIQS
ncbi:hypothetical protein D3C73_1339650 [compost metagenome]